MAQANMNKKLFPILIAFKIAFDKVPLIFELCASGLVHIDCATCQLESQKQKDYPQKEFLFVHSYLPFCLSLIVRFLGVKVMQDSMKVVWEHMRRVD
jgi:hypothetical protein